MQLLKFIDIGSSNKFSEMDKYLRENNETAKVFPAFINTPKDYYSNLEHYTIQQRQTSTKYRRKNGKQ
jgi:hypothetical protein